MSWLLILVAPTLILTVTLAPIKNLIVHLSVRIDNVKAFSELHSKFRAN